MLTSVNCLGSVARFIAEKAEKSSLLDAILNVDWVVPIMHGSGCGMSNKGDGYDIFLRTLNGYAAHPNFGGILLVGLGCEVLQLADLVGTRRISADGGPLASTGVVFMDSPGYDPFSVTGQVVSGATLVASTTGRGSVSGYKPTPCLNVASNSDLFTRMGDDLDVNCGDIVDGVPLTNKGAEIFEALIAVASGQPTRSETLGFGGVEIVP